MTRLSNGGRVQMKGPGKWLFRCIPMHSHASWARNNIMRTPSFFTEGDFSRANFGCESFRPVPEFELICFNLLFHFFAQQHFLLLLLFGLSTKLRGGINFFIFFLLVGWCHSSSLFEQLLILLICLDPLIHDLINPLLLSKVQLMMPGYSEKLCWIS